MRKPILLTVAALALAMVSFGLMRARHGGEAAAQDKGKGGGNADNRVVPVVAATVEKKDVPVFLEGLGTVTPVKTVTIRPRVDGLLNSVSFREGQTVRRGTLLAQIDPRPFQIQVHQAEATLARDRAQLHGAQLTLERYKTVRVEKLIAQQQLDDQQAIVEQLDATTRADQAQVENAKLQLDYARITSPLDGVTGVRLTDAGNLVHANDPTGIVVITQLDPIAVIFTLPQDDLPKVARQMAAGPLEVWALSRDGRDDLGHGEVALIDNQINANTSTIRLKATFPNPKHGLWPNQFVKARLRLMIRQGATVVPAVSVQHGPQGTFVYVIGSDQKVSARPVDVDQVEGELALVTKGLNPGEKVVTDGQYQLRPGSTVSVKTGEEGGAKPPGQGRRGTRP